MTTIGEVIPPDSSKSEGAGAKPKPTPSSDVLAQSSERLLEAKAIVDYYCKWAGGLGLVPIPLIDWALVTGVQLRMLHELCKVYKVRYDKGRASHWISAVVGGLIPSSAGYLVARLVRTIPLIGLAGYAAVPAAAYATTYALGAGFIPHFEQGGTLYTFDPKERAAHFAYYFREGRAAAAATDTPVAAG